MTDHKATVSAAAMLDLVANGRFLTGFAAVLVIAAVVWPLLPRRFESNATVILLMDRDDGTGISHQVRAFPDDNVVQSEIDLISSPQLAAQVVTQLNLVNDPEFGRGHGIATVLRASFPAIAQLLPDGRADASNADLVRRRLEDRLTIVRDRRSYTVKFGYWSNDPVKAAALTGALLTAFIDARAEHRRETAAKVEDWMNSRVAILRTNALASHARVDQFLEETGLIDAGAQTSLESELGALSVALANAVTKTFETKTRLETLTTLRAQGKLDGAPEVLASPFMQKLKESTSAEAARPGAWAPHDREIASRIAAEGDLIVSGAEAEASEAATRETALRGELLRLRNALAKRSRDRSRLDDLDREAKADRTVLDEALVRLKGYVTLGSANAPEVEVVATPEPAPQPTFPKPALATIATLAAASICGLLLAWKKRPAPRGVNDRAPVPTEARPW
jgi:uncharacterized protein involved in exopolysaccharide biosynthesis